MYANLILVTTKKWHTIYTQNEYKGNYQHRCLSIVWIKERNTGAQSFCILKAQQSINKCTNSLGRGSKGFNLCIKKRWCRQTICHYQNKHCRLWLQQIPPDDLPSLKVFWISSLSWGVETAPIRRFMCCTCEKMPRSINEQYRRQRLFYCTIYFDFWFFSRLSSPIAFLKSQLKAMLLKRQVPGPAADLVRNF